MQKNEKMLERFWIFSLIVFFLFFEKISSKTVLQFSYLTKILKILFLFWSLYDEVNKVFPL